jgi:hypothetical protein
MRFRAPVLAVFALAAATTVLAQPTSTAPSSTAMMATSPAGPPKPSPALRALDYFKGTWKCEGTAFANPMMKQHKTSGTATANWELGNYWMGVRYTEAKTAANPWPIDVKMFWGYDPTIKKLVAGNLDNMGGYGTSESEGWKGDVISWTGPVHMGGPTMQRDTFTKKTANQMVHMGEYETSGKWTKADEETCNRVMTK